MAHCPDCGAVLDVEADDLEEGEIITCEECEADLEVVSTHPLEFDVLESDEDLDEDEFDEEEDEEEEEEEDDLDNDEDENEFH